MNFPEYPSSFTYFYFYKSSKTKIDQSIHKSIFPLRNNYLFTVMKENIFNRNGVNKKEVLVMKKDATIIFRMSFRTKDGKIVYAKNGHPFPIKIKC